MAALAVAAEANTELESPPVQRILCLAVIDSRCEVARRAGRREQDLFAHERSLGRRKGRFRNRLPVGGIALIGGRIPLIGDFAAGGNRKTGNGSRR